MSIHNIVFKEHEIWYRSLTEKPVYVLQAEL